MKRNNCIDYYKRLKDRAHIRLIKAEQFYISQCEEHVRFFLNYGFFSNDIKERKLQAYEGFCKAFMDYKKAEEKYYQVKGVC